MGKKTKIVCTLGPATDKEDILEKMLSMGMNVARFNFSHGRQEEHGCRMQLVRKAAKAMGLQVALLLDTKGPEMRIGRFTEQKVKLTEGQKFILTADDIVGSSEKVSISYKGLCEKVKTNDQILLSDGLICLVVQEVNGRDIITTVQNDGILSDLKRIAVPGIPVDLRRFKT